MQNLLDINKFSIKNRKKSKWKNDGFRSLFESIIPNEVIIALKDWRENCQTKNYVVIGGFALSYYTKPRYTEDIDLIFLSYDEIPSSVYKFKRNRKHAFEHLRTGVEIELLTPEHIDKTEQFFNTIFVNAIESDGIKIASPESLIALKLKRFNAKDQSDIDELVRYLRENNKEIDMKKYDLTDSELTNYRHIIDNFNDTTSENLYVLNNKSNLKNKNYIKYNLYDYEIYLIEEEFGEPRFHFTKNINKKIKKFEDFQFAISLTKTFDSNSKFRILESSTEYKSMIGLEKEELILKNWLKENKESLKKSWNKLNRIKIK